MLETEPGEAKESGVSVGEQIRADAWQTLHVEIRERLGLLPNFFQLSPEAPEITVNLWGFAKFAYFDSPLPSLFKERLFVYLSRFCEERYCITRHIGFLIGMGFPAGDRSAPLQSLSDVMRLLRYPIPRLNQLETFLDRLNAEAVPLARIPPPDSLLEEAIFFCAAHVFLQTPDSGRCVAALERIFPLWQMQYVLLLLTFVRAAHYWTQTHSQLRIEPDLEQLLAANTAFADLLANDTAIEVKEIRQELMEELLLLRKEKVRGDERRRTEQRLQENDQLLLNLTRAELAALQKTQRDLVDARRAALNLMEDAIRTREALRHAEERQQMAIKSAHSFTWEVDERTGKTVFSPDAAEVLGYDPAIYLDGSLIQAHPDDRSRVREAVGRAQRGEAGLDVEHRIVHPETGEVIWVWALGRLIASDTGTPPSFIGLTQNVTERKRREASQIFLADLHRLLATAATSAEVVQVFGEQVGQYVGATECAFVEISPDGKQAILFDEWLRPGVRSMIGAYDLTEYVTEAYQARMAAGEYVLVRDVATDAPIRDRARLAGIGVGALLNVPVMRDGRWKYVLGIYHDRPYPWRDDEVALMLETTTHVWNRLEHVRAELALAESRERLRLALDVARMGTFVWYVQEDRGEPDEQMLRLFGQPKNGTLTLREALSAMIHPEDRERYDLAVAQSADPVGKRRLREDIRVVQPDGGWRWVTVMAQVYFQGSPPQAHRMVGAAIDLTESRRTEEALRRSEGRFRELADVVPQLIWTNDIGGQANYFNQRWFAYSGLTVDQSLGLGWQVMVHPDDAPEAVATWERALAKDEVFDVEYRLRGRDGSYRWFIGRNVPAKDEAGHVIGWFGTATDIDDLKRAEEARRESEERLRLLVEGARDYAMFLTDLDGRITFWNTGAERIFGWTENEMRGDMIHRVFTAEDRADGAPEAERETARNVGRSLDRRWHQCKDGSRFWADGILMRLDDEHGRVRGFAKVARDATEQKRGEEAVMAALEAVAGANIGLEERVRERTGQLLVRTEELAEMSEMRQELLRQLVTAQEQERGRISRDLHDDTGQQVTALLLGIQQLRTSTALVENGDAQSLLTQLSDTAGDLAQKSHRMSFTLRPTVLDDIGLVDALRNYTEEWSRWSGLPVDIELVGLEDETGEGRTRRLPPEIETTIYRIVQEALTNVLRHAVAKPKPETAGRGRKRKPVAATRVNLLVQRTADGVVVVVEDDGPGFDVESVLNLPPGKRRLGLFGMQERARLAGGTLTIESKPGNGTTVLLRLPLG